jgi:hypothetical protein
MPRRHAKFGAVDAPTAPAFSVALSVSLLAALFLLAGCASVGVSPQAEQRSDIEGKKPLRLVVLPFGYDRCALRVDREGAELETFKRELANNLASDIAQRTSPLGLKAEVAPKPPVDAEAAWLVRGDFTRVNQGSRAARTLLGFGAGGTKVETRVEVYDLASPSLRPLFTFDTSGGSGAAPGAALSTTPYGFAASVAVGSAAGVSGDRTRTARMIVAYIAEQLAGRGWLASTATQTAGAKRLDASDARQLEGDDAPDPSFDQDDGTSATATARSRKAGWRSK